jgi:hypothetical protein
MATRRDGLWPDCLMLAVMLRVTSSPDVVVGGTPGKALVEGAADRFRGGSGCRRWGFRSTGVEPWPLGGRFRSGVQYRDDRRYQIVAGQRRVDVTIRRAVIGLDLDELRRINVDQAATSLARTM